MDMTNIMVSKSFQKESVRFVLHNVTSPIMQDGYELFPAGYISFPSFWDYKKIKNINKIISRFLEKRREIYDDKVLKCLELIESLIEDRDVMRLNTNDESSFNVAFPSIIEFIKKVGYDYKDNYNKLYDVGNKIIFDDNESDMVKEKYTIIVQKLFKKKIWSFEG